MDHGTHLDASTQSEEALRLAIDAIPALVWTSLPDGYIDYLNKRWLGYTGLPQTEARGWDWQKTVHPDVGLAVDVLVDPFELDLELLGR